MCGGSVLLGAPTGAGRVVADLGRPHIPAEWQRLILRSATEHPRWRAVRIVGELRALGFDVSARTVSRYRQQALDSPERRKPVQRMPSQRVDSKPVPGGLHHEYRWAA